MHNSCAVVAAAAACPEVCCAASTPPATSVLTAVAACMQVRSQNLITDKHFPREVLIGLNKRNPQAPTPLSFPLHAVFDAQSYCVFWVVMQKQSETCPLSQLFDMYRIKLDATSAEPELAASNPGDVLAWLTDADFQIRGSAVRIRAQGSLVHLQCCLMSPSDNDPLRTPTTTMMLYCRQ